MCLLISPCASCRKCLAWLIFLTAFLSQAYGQQLPQQPQSKRALGQWGKAPAAQILGRGPKTPNPYLAFLPPGVAPDFEYWNLEMKFQGRRRREAREKSARSAGIRFNVPGRTESEPNDSQAGANGIELGTRGGDQPALDLFGTVTRRQVIEDTAGPFGEDDGSIALANSLPVTVNRSVHISGMIGDGPHGSSGSGSGDVDVFQIFNLRAGRTLFVDVDTPDSNLDSLVAVLDSQGNYLVFADDDPDEGSFDSRLAFRIPQDGTYYVMMAGYFSLLADPTNSASGFGAGSEGSYEVLIGVDLFDSDYYSFNLQAGDIVGVNALGSASIVGLLDPAGRQRVVSAQDLSFVYPLDTPLPGGGNAVLGYVAEVDGRWALRVDGSKEGNYQVEARVFRREERSERGGVQTLFIDFDGATISGGGSLGAGAVLSPLSAFLPNFGLTPQDEDAVIDAILAVVTENLSQDVRVLGNNGDFEQQPNLGDFDIVILNSRDHPDPFPGPNVSRVIVGGTTSELGISTIGIAESIDIGNYRTGETAFVLLDFLSSTSEGSIPSFSRASEFSIIDAIGVGVGNIVAHEAGHFFGNFHTENQMTLPNIMDQGGNIANTFGVGPDEVFGTADDIDVDFGPDLYVPNEGFIGIEDTLNTIAFGLSTTITRFYFPQYGNGQGLRSEIVLTNPEPRTAVGHIQLFSALGDTLDLGAFSGAGIFEFDGQGFNYTIPPLGSLRISTDGLGAVRAGSAMVTSNPPIGGAVRFEIAGVGVAGVGKSSPLQAAIVPVQRGGGVNTAIAVQNTNSAVEAVVELALHDIAGQPVPSGLRTLTLPPNGREAIFIDELFPQAATDSFQGSVTFSSSVPVAALALELASGQVTTLPVTELP